MQIHVKHEIPDDPVYCCDGDSGGWSTMCGYYQRRNKTGKRGTPIQRGLPRCSLFGEWLEPGPRKCPQCLAAMTDEDAEEQGLLVRLDERTALAIAAGARAIENNKRLFGVTYMWDIFSKFGGPKEISYAESAQILREMSESVLTRQEAEKALEEANRND